MRRLLALYAVGAYAFLHLPLLVLTVFSFNASRFTVWEGFSFDWYAAAIRDPQLVEAAFNSLVIAVVATVISTVIGTCCAYGLWKRGSPWLSGTLYLSLATPEIVMGISLLAFYQWLFRFFGARLGMHTVIGAHVAFSIAFVVDGVPKVSVIFNPAKDRFYKAAAGCGAFLNDAAIRVTPRNDIDGALLLVSRSEPQKKFQVFVDRCEIKPVGSIAYRLAKVAGGDGDATITFRTIHEWDICAGVLMVQEAGGTVVDGSGATMTFNRELPKHRGVVAANGSLAGGLQSMWARAMGDK